MFEKVIEKVKGFLFKNHNSRIIITEDNMLDFSGDGDIEVYFSKFDENTRHVITEKYPVRENWSDEENEDYNNGVIARNYFVNITFKEK